MKILALLLVVTAIGCSGSSTPANDGAADVALDSASDVALDGGADVVATDVVATDAPSADTGPIACGTAQCTNGQICLAVGGGAGISYSCVDLPAACNGVVTCGCLTSVCTQDTHHTCSVSERNVDCSCLDCP